MFDRNKAREVFLEYTSHYDPKDPMISSKTGHTMLVAGNADRIAGSLGLTGIQTDFAYLLGLLHDIGRYEQVKRFGTFVDRLSIDHAELGADILFKEGLIDSFQIDTFPGEYYRICEDSIRLHNKLSLPSGFSGEGRLFADIIRDADKADIFRMVASIPFSERAGKSRDSFKDSETFSDEVMECVRQQRCVPRDLVKSIFDGDVSHICLVFELVFDESKRIVTEQGYLQMLLDGTNAGNSRRLTEKGRQQMDEVRREVRKFLQDGPAGCIFSIVP